MLTCPRCNTVLLRTRAPFPGPSPADAHECPNCLALWLEPGEVARAYPGLADLGGWLDAVRAAGIQARPSLAACPHGHEGMASFPAFGVKARCCLVCRGLWISSRAYRALGEVDATSPGLPSLPVAAGAYRASPSLACSRCARSVPAPGAVLTERGFVCESCAG